MSVGQDTEGCYVTEDVAIMLIRELHHGFKSVRNVGRLKVLNLKWLTVCLQVVCPGCNSHADLLDHIILMGIKV